MSFTGRALCWQAQQYSLRGERSSVGFLHKICLMQTSHFCGCSPFHQGCSTELIRGGVKARAVFRDSHLLGNIKRQQRARLSRNAPLRILQQWRSPGSPLPKSARGHQRAQRLETVRARQPRKALSPPPALPRNCQIFWTAARWN